MNGYLIASGIEFKVSSDNESGEMIITLKDQFVASITQGNFYHYEISEFFGGKSGTINNDDFDCKISMLQYIIEEKVMKL